MSRPYQENEDMNQIERLQADIEFYRRMEHNCTMVLDEAGITDSIYDTPESDEARSLTLYERIALLASERSGLIEALATTPESEGHNGPASD